MTASVKELSRIAIFVRDRVEELKGVRTQREIADIAGYTNPNMITMIKQGMTKVSLDRAVDLAKALDENHKVVMRMALEQFYSPAVVRDLERAMGGILTDNEIKILDAIREASGNSDPKLTPELKERLTAAFN